MEKILRRCPVSSVIMTSSCVKGKRTLLAYITYLLHSHCKVRMKTEKGIRKLMIIFIGEDMGELMIVEKFVEKSNI